MMTSDLQTQFQTYFKDPSLLLHLNTSWSSQNETYRADLRAAVLLDLRQLGDHETLESDILNLDSPPKSLSYKISISHCPSLGGFALSKKYASIGWDIENSSRVSKAIITRIAKDAEPPPFGAALWVAQESSFKAMSPLVDLSHFTQIRIEDWAAVAQNAHRFSAKYVTNSEQCFGEGLVVSSQDLVYAFTGIAMPFSS